MKDSFSFNEVKIMSFTAVNAVLKEIVAMIDEGVSTQEIKDVAEGCLHLSCKTIREIEGDQILQGL